MLAESLLRLTTPLEEAVRQAESYDWRWWVLLPMAVALILWMDSRKPRL